MGAPLPSLEIRNGVCAKCGETRGPHYIPATTGRPLCFRCELHRVDMENLRLSIMIALVGTTAIIAAILLMAKAIGR